MKKKAFVVEHFARSVFTDNIVNLMDLFNYYKGFSIQQ